MSYWDKLPKYDALNESIDTSPLGYEKLEYGDFKYRMNLLESAIFDTANIMANDGAKYHCGILTESALGDKVSAKAQRLKEILSKIIEHVTNFLQTVADKVMNNNATRIAWVKMNKGKIANSKPSNRTIETYSLVGSSNELDLSDVLGFISSLSTKMYPVLNDPEQIDSFSDDFVRKVFKLNPTNLNESINDKILGKKISITLDALQHDSEGLIDCIESMPKQVAKITAIKVKIKSEQAKLIDILMGAKLNNDDTSYKVVKVIQRVLSEIAKIINIISVTLNHKASESLRCLKEIVGDKATESSTTQKTSNIQNQPLLSGGK